MITVNTRKERDWLLESIVKNHLNNTGEKTNPSNSLTVFVIYGSNGIRFDTFYENWRTKYDGFLYSYPYRKLSYVKYCRLFIGSHTLLLPHNEFLRFGLSFITTKPTKIIIERNFINQTATKQIFNKAQQYIDCDNIETI